MWLSVLFLVSFAFTTTFQQELTPNGPSQVTAVAVSCESIRVTWNAVSFNGTQLDTYKVFYKKNTSDSQKMMVVDGGLEALLTGLSHLTTYSISVAAMSSDIVGAMSPEIQKTTFGAVPATNLRVDNVTNHSAIFSWEISRPNIGCNGNPINHDTKFRVRYKSEDASEQQRINLRETSVELPDLLPFTNYSVFIITADLSGPNQRSSDLFFTSLPGVPSAPINVTTTINNSVPTQLVITWQEPVILNGIISHYDVEYGEQGSQSQMVKTSDIKLPLNELNPSGVYDVRVRANNFAKLDRSEPGIIPGPFTDVTTIRLPDPLPVPPGHPRDFKATPSVLYGTKIELHFSWKQPSIGDPVRTYWIMCNTSSAHDNSTSSFKIRIALPTLHLKTRHINAEPYTSYQCHAYASNEVGNGPFSRTISISPVPLASSRVQQLQAVPLNYSHVRLTWNKPNSRNDFITSYFVTLRDPSANTVTNFTVPTPTTSLMVEALTGNTMYTFDVMAVSMFNGKQLNSNITSTSVTTPTGTPSYPRNVVVEAINRATVQVHWDPPIPTNGIITRYRVDAEVKSVYSTENGQREFSDSLSVMVQDRYFTMPLLTPGTNYIVNVTAYTNDGPGPTASLNAMLDNGRIDAITYFQLKLRPFMDCSKSQETATKQDIRDQLVRGLEKECACVLDPDATITDMQTQCNDEDAHLIYIGRIIGTKDLRPSILLGLLEDWKNKNTLILQESGESLMMDQSCPLYLSSPRDPNCVPKVNPTSSSSVPSASPQPTGSVEELEDSSDDDKTLNIPILIGCFIGGVFLGCLITLCILVIVFCCRIRKRRKEIAEEAIYARPSRKNKRIKVTANGKKNPVQMQTYPACSLDDNDKESDYDIPKKRSGSIDSVDLQLYRTDSKIRGINNPLHSTSPHRAPYTPPLPPPYDHNRPNGFYSMTKQARSMDNLSSYTNGHVTTGRNDDSLYQSPRYPSLSVDDLLNGIPSQKLHYNFSPLHSSARSPVARPRTPKDTYDDPRTPYRVVAVGNSTYDAPRSHTQPGIKPSLVNDVRASPKSVPRTPKDAYDDPRKPSATVTVGDATYDSPRNLHDREQTGTPTKPILMNDITASPKSVPRTPKDAYDDPRQPLVVSVGNSTYDTPRKQYNYIQLEAPIPEEDKDDPDYCHVE